MAELTYDQLSDRLASGKLGGNFFLKTEDTFLRDEAIRLLTATHLEGGAPDFDLDQLDGDDVDAEDLASRIDMPPLVSPYRVVVVRGAQRLTPTARSVIEAAVETEVATRVLIIAAEIPRGSKAKFYKRLAAGCAVVSLRAPAESELPGWLAERAREAHGLKVEMRAAELLVAAIGSDLGALAQELEKLTSFVAPKKSIGEAEVRAAVGVLPRVDRWGWIDGVMDRRFGEALRQLPLLLDSGESAVGLIGSLSEAMLRVGIARSGKDALAAVLKRDGSYGHLRWKIRIYARQASGWSPAAIDRGLAELLRADRLIKSGGLADREALREALLRIAHSQEGGRTGGRQRLGGGRQSSAIRA